MRYVLLGFFTLYTLACFSADQSPAAQIDPTELGNFLPKECNHAGQFKQEKLLAGLVKPLVTEGIFLFGCNRGLIWQTQTPINETLVYRIHGPHLLIHADHSSQLLGGRLHRELGKMLNGLVGGNAEYLQENFTSVATVTGMELKPKRQSIKKFLQKLELTNNGNATDIKMWHGESTYTAIHITDRQHFPSLNAAQCEPLFKQNPIACATLFKEI